MKKYAPITFLIAINFVFSSSLLGQSPVVHKALPNIWTSEEILGSASLMTAYDAEIDSNGYLIIPVVVFGRKP